MKISSTMNLDALASLMGPGTLREEAKAMRELLHWKNYEDTKEINPSNWIKLVDSVRVRTYQVALMDNSGNWDILEDFEVIGDKAANEYAEENYPDEEWYVLRNGTNINA